MNLLTLKERFTQVGYYARIEELSATKALLTSERKFLLIEGLPGVGKTFYSKKLAKVVGAKYIYHLFHSWSDDQELFAGISIPAVVSGDADNVIEEGVLLKAARLSHEGPVVLCLDELDKAPERVENLLLGFLQDGIVPVKPGVVEKARLENLFVVITTNGLREIGGPLKRRVRRIYMRPLSLDVVTAVLSDRFDVGLVKVVHKVIAGLRGESISISELDSLLQALLLAESLEEVRVIIASYSDRPDQLPPKQRAASIWGQLRASKTMF